MNSIPSSAHSVIGSLVSSLAAMLLGFSSAQAQSGSFTTLSVNGSLNAAGGRVTGANSVSLGTNSNSMGDSTFTLGLYSNATAYGAIGLGGGYAKGYYSLAFGGNAYAKSLWSVALGWYAQAGSDQVNSDYSMAIGMNSTAWGSNSLAIGPSTYSHSVHSVAIGFATEAAGPCQTAVGALNIPSDTSWNSPSFIVGNGYATDDGDGSETWYRSNALEIMRNGDMWVQGVITSAGMRTPPKGDLSMGSFTSGPLP